MQYSTNYNMNKPELVDQYDVQHWNDNTDKIDTELKKREDDDTALKNPVYTEAGADANLVSGELFSTAFGKIAKAISSFITHKATTTSVHGSTPNATANKIVERDANGRIKIGGATELNEAIVYKQLLDNQLLKRFVGVKVVALSNITLSGEQVIDGVSCVVGDFVLAPSQTTQTQNGVYKVETGAWTRLSDYNTKDLINNTYLCILDGTKKGRMYKADVDSYTEGTTVLIYVSDAEYFSGNSQSYWRDKINACEEYRPPIGVPYFWMGSKPSWAIDFGNGASTKYLWTNYPNLNNNQFKDILTTLSTEGWMTAYDTSGFYAPDLRGMTPVGYGVTGLASRAEHGSYPTGGNAVGKYLPSGILYHAHDKGTYRIYNGYFKLRDNVFYGSSDDAVGQFYMSRDNVSSEYINIQGNSAGWRFYFDTDRGGSWTGNCGYSGAYSKSPTFAGMWIVRFR